MLSPAPAPMALPAPNQAQGAQADKAQVAMSEAEQACDDDAAGRPTSKGRDKEGETKPTPKLAVEACTDAILAGLKDRDAEKAKTKDKAKAKCKVKGKATCEPKPAKVLPTITKAKGKAKCEPKNAKISKPRFGEPVYFGQCTIMHGQGKWRVTTATNRRFDKAFSFKKPGAWDDLVAYCMANK